MHIVTVVNGIGETSMPYNEFVLYKAKYFTEYKQTVLVCSPVPSSQELPDNVQFISVGTNPAAIRKATKHIIADAKKSGEKVVFHLHQAGSAAIFLLATLGLGVRKHSVLSMHTQYPALSKKNRVLNRIAVALAGKTVFVSHAARNAYPKKLLDKMGDKAVTVVNGVDSARVDLALIGAKKEPHNIVELVYVSRIIPLKNHDFLLKVIKRVDNAKLLLIGADASGDFNRKIADAGLESRVEAVGLLPRDEVFRRIYQSDIYVSSSTIEGMPISVLEAMCCGLPVVLSDIPPHTQITETGDFGYSLPFDEDLWADTLNKMAAMSAAERAALGAKGRECALTHFSLDSMHGSYNEIYNAIAK